MRLVRICLVAALTAALVPTRPVAADQAGAPRAGPAVADSIVGGDAQDLGVRWARIPAGKFQMGCVPGDAECSDDEKPQHAVTLTRAYDLMTTEVTLGMFRPYANATSRSVPAQPNSNTDARQPVVTVTWDEATPPRPHAFMHQLAGRLPDDRRLNGGKLAGTIREVLAN